MGNIGSQSGQIDGIRENELRTEEGGKKYLSPAAELCHRTVKVLPDIESGQQLRHTNNGVILHYGGTLSGRHQTDKTRFRNVHSSRYAPTKRYSFNKTGFESLTLCQDVASQTSLERQLKPFSSEPDLRFSSSVVPNMRGKKMRKKYRAPPPPTSRVEHRTESAIWDERENCDEYPGRRARLFKRRFESKKQESSQAQGTFGLLSIEDNSAIFKEQMEIEAGVNCSRPESHPEDPNKFKVELREAAGRLRATKIDAIGVLQNEPPAPSPSHCDSLMERRYARGEPSGKESSTPEASPILMGDIQKPRSFYFGMERKYSDVSSSYQVEDDEETSTIALHLRPVLPRKMTEIPRFSPAIAWKLLDARSQDSGISGDARSTLPAELSWTPQQDLNDDSSIDDAIQEESRSVTTRRPHVFSLSLPRDHTAMAVSNKSAGVSSLGRFKRSVSGVLNTLSIRNKEQDKRTMALASASSREDHSNWFFTRSAPNSLNETSLELPEAYFPHVPSTARLMYLPETTIKAPPSVEHKHLLSAFSKSCEQLQVPESLCDVRSVLNNNSGYKEELQRKTKKFTFQSTLRQIERRKMADKLSKEAKKKEKQRLEELEAMQRVEEEFQKKRAKEKANIRQQLRLYAMDDNQWSSLPFGINIKSEERQEPDGALSSSNSSISFSKCDEEHQLIKNKNSGANITKELSEYRQIERDYKEYRRAEKRHCRPTTVHPKITYNMPTAKGLNSESGNYRKDFAYGMKSTKSVSSSIQSEDSQHNYSPKMFSKKYSLSFTRF